VQFFHSSNSSGTASKLYKFDSGVNTSVDFVEGLFGRVNREPVFVDPILQHHDSRVELVLMPIFLSAESVQVKTGLSAWAFPNISCAQF